MLDEPGSPVNFDSNSPGATSPSGDQDISLLDSSDSESGLDFLAGSSHDANLVSGLGLGGDFDVNKKMG